MPLLRHSTLGDVETDQLHRYPRQSIALAPPGFMANRSRAASVIDEAGTAAGRVPS